MERFVGKIAVVTGASSGIGAGIVEKLVEGGLVVFGLARRVDLVEDLAEKLKERPGKLHAIKCDVGVEEELISSLESIEANFGPIYVLVNNAGITNIGPVTDGYSQKMRDVINVNFMATVIATTEVLKYMQKNKVDGHIINISSISADVVLPKVNMYGCAKTAVNYFSEVARRDLVGIGSKIKISILSPGLTSTDMVNKEGTEMLPKLEVNDVANSIVYILNTSANVQVQKLVLKPVGEPF